MADQTTTDPTIPATMQAATISGINEPLQLETVPTPTPVMAEAIIKVHAAGVNPIDAKTRLGAPLAATIPGFPFVLGNDFSGEVVFSPYEASAFPIGTEVFGMASAPRVGGSYAEYVAVPINQLAKKPRSLTYSQAAAVPVAALTAWGAVVEVAKARPGQRILIHAGAGGVGHFAVQLAAYFGATVITTANASNQKFLRSLGAREVVDYTKQRFEEVIAPVDVVIDLIGNVVDETATRSLRILKPGGLIVSVPSGAWPTMDEEAFNAGVRATRYKVSANGDTLSVISRLIDSGDLQVHIDDEFPLADAQVAHDRILEGHVHGKIVLDIAGD